MRLLLVFTLVIAAFAVQAQQYYQQLIHSVQVPISAEQAWENWTTAEGITSFFAPGANIGANMGEPYEVLIDTSAVKGKQGNEGCIITQYQPYEKLGFQWIAPPKFPTERKVKTEVFLLFETEYPYQTKVTLAQVGWQEGGEWAAVYEYFDKAWQWVLSEFEAYTYTQALAPFSFLEGTWQSGSTGDYLTWTINDKSLTSFMHTQATDTSNRTNEYQLYLQPTALFYTPLQNAEATTPYTVSEVGDSKIILDRAGDVFPNKLSYQRDGNTLLLTKEGNKDGKPYTEQVTFTAIN